MYGAVLNVMFLHWKILLKFVSDAVVVFHDVIALEKVHPQTKSPNLNNVIHQIE